MITTILLFALPFLSAFINRLRGGGFLSLSGGSAYIAAAILTALIFGITLNPIVAGAFLVAYVLGESFGWGKWLAAIPFWNDKSFTQEMYNSGQVKASNIPLIERKDGKNNGIHLIANLISKETEDFRSYSWWALVIRGIFWWGPVLAALTATGAIHFVSAILGTIVLGFAFPILYQFSYKMFTEEYWGRGEMMYGFVQGLILSIALTVGV